MNAVHLCVKQTQICQYACGETVFCTTVFCTAPQECMEACSSAECTFRAVNTLRHGICCSWLCVGARCVRESTTLETRQSIFEIALG